MASLFDTGIFSVIGINSDILPGALLNWYASGTSDRLATYADDNLTVANPNPVPAYADGRFPAIWLQDEAYKMVLTDADGIVLVTRDPINVNQLSAPDGSTHVGYIAEFPDAVPRTVYDKLAEPYVSVKDFGATGDGVTDDLAAFDAAVASGARCIYIPSTTSFYRLSATWRVSRSVKIMGDGCAPYVGSPPGTRGAGSWLKCDHLGEGILLYGAGGTETSGGEVRGIGTIRNQPASTPGWAPAANDYDISVVSGDWYLDDILLWNATKGLKHDFAGYGRCEIGRLRGHVFTNGVYIDRCFDVFRAQNIHFWPFSGIDANYSTWTYANLIGITIRKVDGAFIDDFFCIGARTGILTLIGADGGIPTHVMFNNAYIDLFGKFAVYVDATADGGAIEISKLIGQGAVNADGNPAGADVGVVVAADAFILKIGQFQINRVNQQAAIITGAGSTMYISQPTVIDWNQTALPSTAFDATGTSARMIISEKVTTSGGGGAPVVPNSSALISSQEYVDDAPTPTATIGTFTLAAATVQRNRCGNIVQVNMRIAITTNGTAAGTITVPLTVSGRTGKLFALSAKENAVSGKAGIGIVNGNTIGITAYDNTYLGGNGTDIYVTGVYEADPL